MNCNTAEKAGIGAMKYFLNSSSEAPMSEKATEWFGMRVTPSQKQKIERLAERKGLTQKAAVLEAVEPALTE